MAGGTNERGSYASMAAVQLRPGEWASVEEWVPAPLVHPV